MTSLPMPSSAMTATFNLLASLKLCLFSNTMEPHLSDLHSLAGNLPPFKAFDGIGWSNRLGYHYGEIHEERY